MKTKLQFGTWLLTLGVGVSIAFPAEAQNRPPKPQQERRQEQRQEHHQERPSERRNDRNQGNPNRPPTTNQSVVPNSNRPPERARNQQSTNRPPANTAPQRNLNNLSPQERQRTLDNYRNYQRLPQGQRLQMQEAARNWGRMTQEQKNHVKNDVMPKWQQLPPQRQRAIQQRLGVLKNMPESARNQHLSDPNFTRGMTDEDKSMLRDLSHLHVGGTPEPPNE